MTTFLPYISSLLLFFLILLTTSKNFFHGHLSIYVKKRLRKDHLSINNIPFTYEQIIFFYTRPSLIPAIQHAKKEHLELVVDYQGLLFTEVKGMKVFLHNIDETIFLAYLSLENFRSPTLDKLKKENNIEDNEYDKICTYKLILPSTKEEMANEVLNQLKTGRYNIAPA